MAALRAATGGGARSEEKSVFLVRFLNASRRRRRSVANSRAVFSRVVSISLISSIAERVKLGKAVFVRHC